ncbi:MAG: choice-of-anchor D domain-containing protein, partial [Spirochaetes bacterium]|nr:choice-of-anchor D domain-containing protein [Spirochaetota bacterium]
MSDTGIRRVFLSVFILFTACNGKMIEKGIESTLDPRVPEINIKQGSADINIDDSVVIASSGTQFIIENTGTEDLELTGAAAVSIAGDNPGDFEISEMPSGTVIPAGRNESFTITFVPQVEGTREATVTIESNDFDENPYVFNVTGTSNPEIYVKQGAMDVESGTGNFPISNIKVGESSDPILFTIENRGSFDLELTGATPLVTSGDTLGELAVTQPSDLTIVPGSETTFQVTFTPANTDAKIITVTIPNNDPDYGDFSFTITVTSKPVPDYSARLRKGLAPLIVSFEDATSGEVTSYEWDFNGDGITDSTDQNPVFTFSGPGSYSIVLSVKGPPARWL